MHSRSLAALVAAATLPLVGLSALPAQAAEGDTQVNVLFEATGSGLSVGPGQVVGSTNVLNLEALTGGAAVPANSLDLTVTATGPATVGTSANLFSVGYGGSSGLGGCSGRGSASVTCTGGNPFSMNPGSSISYNHIRVPFTVSPDALPGDVITLTSTIAAHAGYENINPTKSVEWQAIIPLTTATIATTGTVGTTPTITGGGVPGATVDVSVAGRPAITVTVATDGTWSLPVTTPLASGTAAITAVQHRNGFTAAQSSGSVTVDADAPGAPSVEAPGTWEDGTGTLSGTAEPGSTVIVRDADGTEIGRTTADPATGDWSLPVTGPLPEGDSTLSVVAVDEHGNESATATATVTVPDTTAPEAPSIDEPDTWTDATGPLTGTAEPGSTVEIRDAVGALVGSGVASPDGRWSVVLDRPLATGTTDLSVTATDAAGNRSDSATTTVTVTATGGSVVPPGLRPGGLDKPGTGSGATGSGAHGSSSHGHSATASDAGERKVLAYTGSEGVGTLIGFGLVLSALGLVLRLRRRAD